MKSLTQLEDAFVAAVAGIEDYWPALIPTTVPALTYGTAGSDTVSGLDRRISLAHEVMTAVNGWCRVIVEDRGTQHHIPLGHDVPGMLKFLRRHALWFSGHEAIHDATTELAEYATKVRATVAPTTREWVILGPCPFVVGDEVADRFCAGTIRGYGDGRDPDCSLCGQTAIVEWWQDVLRSATPRQVNAHQLVQLVHREFGRPAKAATVRVWVSRQWIAPVACNVGDRSMMFDTEDTIRALAQQWGASA